MFLYDQGFFIIFNFYYVCNYGLVFQVYDVDVLLWFFIIEGFCFLLIIFILVDFIFFCFEDEVVFYLVILVCVGNCCKEQNQVCKFKGFLWGVVGFLIFFWIGLLFGYFFFFVGVNICKGKFVYFEGVDVFFNGYYGMLVKLSYVMDLERGMMIFWLMNGFFFYFDYGKFF